MLAIGLMSPGLAHAQETTHTALGEVANFGEFISLVWGYGSQVLIAMAVFFIILGAFFYVASAGNKNKILQGRQMIFGSLIAIFIVMLSGVLIRTLHQPAEGTTGYLSDVPNVIFNASNILVGIIASFTVLMFIYAGLMYATATGNTEKLKKATDAFKYAVIGLAVGILAFAIVNNVINYFL